LHPPNHYDVISQKVKALYIEPVKLSNEKGEWSGFPDGYTERHFKKFEEVKKMNQELGSNGWGC
jgi:hypothetical protein